jgi:hypothetical protein
MKKIQPIDLEMISGGLTAKEIAVLMNELKTPDGQTLADRIRGTKMAEALQDRDNVNALIDMLEMM